MKYFCLVVVGLLFGSTAFAIDPCKDVSGWRESLCEFAKKNLVHSAWGFEHSKRDYLLASELAAKDGVAVDDDVLFAAAMLHDMGGFAPYEIEGVDHALRSIEVLDPVLTAANFPMQKSAAVKKAVLTHSYYCPDRPETGEALVLHDADTLDFMGDISVARIFSVVGREKGIATVRSAYQLLRSFEGSLSAKVYGGKYARAVAAERRAQLTRFLASLREEAFGEENL